MTLQDAIALQPAWLNIWLNWMMIGGFIAPLALLIWRETRLAAIVTLIAGVLSAFGVSYLFDTMGYVKLLGLPHILFWTPAAYLLWKTSKQQLPKYARPILWIVLGTILVSLAFDYTDVIRYILGERTPFAG